MLKTVEYKQIGTPLISSYYKHAYQLIARFDTGRFGLDATFIEASSIIYEWIWRKYNRAIFIPRNIQTFAIERDGKSIGIIFDAKQMYFVMRISHLDSRIAGRVWISEAEIIKNGNLLYFAVRNSCSTIACSSEPVPFSIPVFVRKLSKEIGIIDLPETIHCPRIIESKEDCNDLYNFLTDSKRKLPVVVISECNPLKNEYGNYCEGYLVDYNTLSDRLQHIPHIVCMPHDITYKWTDLVGKNWSLFDGTVRTYYPKIDFESDDYFGHPLTTKERILASYIVKDNVEYIANAAFEQLLISALQNFNVNYRIGWSDYGFKFYFLANREVINKERTSDKHTITELEVLYKVEISELEQENEFWKQTALTYSDESDSRKQIIDELKKQISNLKVYNESLKAQLTNIKGQNGIEEIEIQDSYEVMSDWIAKYFPGRLLLHSRAAKSIKNAEYEDVGAVYEALKLLGSYYYDMRIGSKTKEEFEQECLRLCIEEGRSISDVGAGEQDDEYYVVYEGKKTKLDRHLSKGVSRDRRYCLRIYFFWDDENSIVVIGDLPHHLSLRIS